MVFLPGDHVLNTNITVYNVTRLTMDGASSGHKAAVVCSGPVGLSFTSLMDFKIYSLAFTSCSRKYGSLAPTDYALLLQFTQNAKLVSCSFHDNIGTALVVNNTSVTLAGNSEFTHNYCQSTFCLGGGGIAALSSYVTFIGNTTFLENIALFYEPHSNTSGGGGAIYTSNNSVLSFNGNNNFTSNLANYGGDGGAICASNAALTFKGTSNFINNSADSGGFGGAIIALDNTVISFNGTNNFINNSANYGLGGAVLILDSAVLSLNGINNLRNNTAVYGGAIYTLGHAVIRFNGASNFISNSAGFGHGGAIYASDHAAISFIGASNFISNSAGGDGGAVYTPDNAVLDFIGTNNFINNSALSNGGGGIFADFNSTLKFNGIINFTMNGEAYSGGGLYMGLKSTLSILPNTTMYWDNNYATLGGAIYVEDASPLSYCSYLAFAASISTYVPKEKCFFQLPDQNLSNSINVQLLFKNNFAYSAGSVLYGGAIENCKLTGLESYSSAEVFDKIFHSEDDNDYNTASNISSDPFRICRCENNLPDCSKSQYDAILVTAYPGETFHVSVASVGQRDGTVSSTVRSIVLQTQGEFLSHAAANDSWLLESQYLQSVSSTCTNLNYTMFSLSPYVDIVLQAEGNACLKVEFAYTLLVGMNVTQNCPPGFNISESTRSCTCEPRLAKYTQQCNITNGLGQITRDSGQPFWVGYDNQSDGLILHPHCPFDYCVANKVVFSLNNTDVQCAYKRSGILCGACKNGYSLVLGTSQCKQRTNSHLTLIIPFALMGVALVFLLLVCKLTVATGTLSGLVFYANIIGANRTIFLPVKSPDVLSVFIAWLNLDLGIETCFYNGMDSYSKTWLQFVFPAYIWMIVGLVVVVCNYSPRFANLLGSNPVSVLATLILLSYTKVLRTLITVIYVTYLEYPNYHKGVWLYDANIDYLSGKHIPLFVVAVFVFLFLFFPYTLLLLFGQWLQAISHLKLFSWVNSARLKLFMDSYHAPYKGKHRYWPGLLLVLRFGLLLVFAFEFNPQKDTSISLLVILVGTGMLQMWAWVSGGVYRNWCLDALEGSCILNLIILTASTMYTYHVSQSEEDQLVAGYTSVSIVFVTFVGILVFQLASVTGIVQYLKRKCKAITLRNRHQTEAEVEPPDIGSLPDRLINPGEYEPPLHTSQDHAIAEPIEVHRRLTPLYTYGSIS